jgi:putative membrane protein
MRIVVWLFRAFIFFTLFAFALNNQQEVAVRWFFGYEWRSPMVIIVLAAFAGGCAFGVMAMVPSWWRHRRVATRQVPEAQATATPTTTAVTIAEPVPEHPPRIGL